MQTGMQSPPSMLSEMPKDAGRARRGDFVGLAVMVGRKPKTRPCTERLKSIACIIAIFTLTGCADRHQSAHRAACERYNASLKFKPSALDDDPIIKSQTKMMDCYIVAERNLSSDTQDSTDVLAHAVLERCRSEVMEDVSASESVNNPERTASQWAISVHATEEYVLDQTRMLVVARRAAGCAGQ